MNKIRVIALALLAVVFCWPALAEDLQSVPNPQELGFDSDRLARVTHVFQAYVDQGELPGAVVLIARHGKLAFFQAFGYQDREKKVAMSEDSIFRIASMTKPITTVAAMMLAEEGKLDLLAPVSAYLPEFKTVQVAVEKQDAPAGAAEIALQPSGIPSFLSHRIKDLCSDEISKPHSGRICRTD